MSYVAEFTIPPESFPFGETLVEMDDVEIELDQIIPTDEAALPFFWVRGCDPEAFMTRAEHEAEVKDTRKLEAVDDTALFRAEWRPNVEVIAGLRELDATIVESIGTADGWHFEVRTQDRRAFRRFRTIFEEAGIPVDLERVYDLERLLDGDRTTVTEDQREALLVAFEAGYFETPRGITQQELGERIGVSSRAVSERLRRGVRNLLREQLLSDDPVPSEIG